MAEILIIDDHKFGSVLLKESLDHRGHNSRVITDPKETASALTQPTDVAIVDILFLGSDWTGVDVLHVIATSAPAVKTILYTEGGEFRSLEITVAIEQFTPSAVVMKTEEFLFQALEAVLAGGSYTDPGMVPYMLSRRSASPARLVEHETHRNVWLALAEGHTSTAEIAARTGYTTGYVENQTKEMRELLQDLEFVNKEKLRLQDLARFAQTHKLFLVNEYRRHLTRGH